MRHGLNLSGLRYRSDEPIEREVITPREEVVRPREVVVHRDERDERDVPRHGVLGLS